jgi:hypothetical protein
VIDCVRSGCAVAAIRPALVHIFFDEQARTVPDSVHRQFIQILPQSGSLGEIPKSEAHPYGAVLMLKILAAIGLGASLMLAPVLAHADDAAKMAPKHHHHMMKHHHPMKHHHAMKHHHMMKHMMMKHHHHMMKKMHKPAAAPKS